MDSRAMWNHCLHLADEGLVDVNTELRNVDHLIDGMVRPVLDSLDVRDHLTQNRAEWAITEAFDKWLHQAGNVRLNSMDWLVMKSIGNNVGLYCIVKRVLWFFMKTLNKVVARFDQGMLGFVVQTLEMRHRFARNTVMRNCMKLL